MIGFPKAVVKDVPRPQTQIGMRRVSWVRIVLDEHGARCEALGVGHRFPSTRRIALETALALSAEGVPTVIRAADGTPTEPTQPSELADLAGS